MVDPHPFLSHQGSDAPFSTYAIDHVYGAQPPNPLPFEDMYKVLYTHIYYIYMSLLGVSSCYRRMDIYTHTHYIYLYIYVYIHILARNLSLTPVSLSALSLCAIGGCG